METFLTHPFDEFRLGRWRAAWVAFGITLLMHLLVFLALPERIFPAQRQAKENEPVVYEIDLVEPQDMRYVEPIPKRRRTSRTVASNIPFAPNRPPMRARCRIARTFLRWTVRRNP